MTTNHQEDDLTDDAVTRAATAVGSRYGMTAEQVLLHAAIGDQPHPDAPPDVCGATDPRDDTRWCVLAPAHTGEGHNGNAPLDGCRTWREHEQHDLPDEVHVSVTVGHLTPADIGTVTVRPGVPTHLAVTDILEAAAAEMRRIHADGTA